jgi:hypothetical protein
MFITLVDPGSLDVQRSIVQIREKCSTVNTKAKQFMPKAR